MTCSCHLWISTYYHFRHLHICVEHLIHSFSIYMTFATNSYICVCALGLRRLVLCYLLHKYISSPCLKHIYNSVSCKLVSTNIFYIFIISLHVAVICWGIAWIYMPNTSHSFQFQSVSIFMLFSLRTCSLHTDYCIFNFHFHCFNKIS